VTLTTILVIALLIALNGLYVAAEFASVTVRRSRLSSLAENGNAVAGRLLPILEDPHRLDRYIACCQIGITVSSLGLGAFGQARLATALTPVFSAWGAFQGVGAQSAATAVVLVVLTVLQMVLGELVPKSLALQHPTRLALLTYLPMRFSERALSWLVDVLNGSGWAVLRLMRVQPVGHRHVHSPEEIRYLVAESTEGGLIDVEERLRVDRALGLAQRTARDLMVPRTRVAALERSVSLEHAVREAAALPFTRLPVFEGSLDKVVGFVHAKDLARASFSGRAEATIEPLIRPVMAVQEQLSADRVLTLLKEKRAVIAMVVDEFGGTAGLISVEDVLAEVLGESADEFRPEEERPRRLPGGDVLLPGDLRLYAVPRWLGVRWSGESDTVGGLVAERLGRMAQKGDTLEIDDARVEVVAVEGNAVSTVIVRRPSRSAGPPEAS
jgi:putative hemolysin